MVNPKAKDFRKPLGFPVSATGGLHSLLVICMVLALFYNGCLLKDTFLESIFSFIFTSSVDFKWSCGCMFSQLLPWIQEYSIRVCSWLLFREEKLICWIIDLAEFDMLGQADISFQVWVVNLWRFLQLQVAVWFLLVFIYITGCSWGMIYYSGWYWGAATKSELWEIAK